MVCFMFKQETPKKSLHSSMAYLSRLMYTKHKTFIKCFFHMKPTQWSTSGMGFLYSSKASGKQKLAPSWLYHATSFLKTFIIYVTLNYKPCNIPPAKNRLAIVISTPISNVTVQPGSSVIFYCPVCLQLSYSILYWCISTHETFMPTSFL